MISVAALSLFAFLAYRIWRNSPPHILKDIRGPPSPSFWLGTEKVFRHALEEVLWTVDPRALQYIFHTSGYKFCKGIVPNMISLLFTGDSILIQDSVDHKRHRKIMNPAFGAAQLRSFLPAFRRPSSRLSQKWKETIQLGEKTDNCIINVENALSRITLDVLGEVCFDHRFGVFDNNGEDSELAQAFNNLFVDSSLHSPSWNLIFKATWRYLPQSILSCIKYLPTKEYRRASTFLQTAIRTGKALASEMAAGKKIGKEVTSILGKYTPRQMQSNLSEDTRFQLSDREMYSQIAVLLFAGHSTSSLSLTWLLYELSKHPEDQQRIRDEIRALAEARGDDDVLPSDFSDMSFTNAVIKEGFTFHPIAPTLFWEAKEDRKIVQEIPILKGQSIRVSVCALKSVWGEDADEWNPTMQALLVELIENFEYRLPEGVDIARLHAGFMIPMIAGKMDEGVQMPLQVSLVN
ncbi:cytochrome P450 [Rhizopogon vinicolor AM-OR11-026]|uniref:Cytochrome P450 n=1 Tax=Rhizopogon vinicolor AM-OR11-026 TaxID=1314800 RepID=A0A1B7MZI9_9AGAM|nr:cytochrome P450 [Rhizopogon vinicolor AM-OR11-026]